MNHQNLVLVTGGSGFIAGWCIVRLLQAGWRVRATLLPDEREEDIRSGLAREANLKEVNLQEQLSFVVACLNQDAGWAEATAGVTYILHIASPLPSVMPRYEHTLMDTAVNGTLRVLRAARASGVKRIVFTSSTAAIAGRESQHSSYIYTEQDWVDVNKPKLSSPYSLAKAAAEQTAWSFVAQEGEGLELATINPVWVLGPVIHSRLPASLQVIQKLLRGDLFFGCPHLGWAIVDVRDIADLHLLAMTHPAASGERFIGGSQWMWMHEMAAVLQQELSHGTGLVPSFILPNILVRFLSLFDPVVRSVVPDLSRKIIFDYSKSQRVLQWHPQYIDTTIADTARSILAYNLL